MACKQISQPNGPDRPHTYEGILFINDAIYGEAIHRLSFRILMFTSQVAPQGKTGIGDKIKKEFLTYSKFLVLSAHYVNIMFV